MNVLWLKKSAALLALMCGLGFKVGAARLTGGCLVDGDGWVSADGGCKDTATGRVWGSSANGQSGSGNWIFTYDSAKNFCSSSTEGGVTGWRVPTLAELKVAQSHGAFNHINQLDFTGQLWDSHRWSIDLDKSKQYGYWLRFSDGNSIKVLIKAKQPGGGTAYSMTDVVCVR